MSSRASLAALALLSVVSLGFQPPVARSDDFSDFRIPPNRSLLWTMGFSADGGNSDRDGATIAASNAGLGGSASTQASWLLDSDPAFTVFAGSLALSGSRSRDESALRSIDPTTTLVLNEESHHRSTAENWALALSHRRYLGKYVAASLSLSGDGEYAQAWDRRSERSLQRNPIMSLDLLDERGTQTWNYVNSVRGGAGLGIGHVRNATGIYDALVLEQRLRESGALTRPLSGQARRRLADLMYVRGAFAGIHERPARSIWKEIETIAADDGALSERGLDPYSVLHATEPHFGGGGPTVTGIPSSPLLRLTGTYVGVSVNDVHTHTVARQDLDLFQQQTVDDTMTTSLRSHSGVQNTDHVDASQGELDAEYHRPMGPRWQVDAASRVALPLRKEQTYLAWQSNARVGWLVTDRWLASSTISQTWFDANRTAGSTPQDRISFAYNLSVSYFVEDHLVVDLSAGASQARFHPDPGFPGGGTRFARNESVSLGLTYRFAGWFDSPGMFAPIAR